jgi:murein DD-endopeptidase MepM/ murein hydrolase activator NlpD
MDDGHHGIDLAYWSRGDRKTMLGHPVQSVLTGRVAGQVLNLDPYGYALIIETPLEDLPASWMETTALPTPAPTIQPAANLYCPTGGELRAASSGRSLYLLYAHMNQPPLVRIQDSVQCGQQIGEVGTTGKSVNLHLHLETRIGPSGVTFPDMAHYENDATQTEMQSYCAWRVSGLFQMFDPVILFQGQTLQP